MNNVREQFPLLQKTVNGKPLVYFDMAATTPKPQQVINVIADHYANHGGNPGRGNHFLARESEKAIEDARATVLSFLSAPDSYGVTFTKNTTESINAVAFSLLTQYHNASEKPLIIITEAEHHANFLSWLRLHKEFGFPLYISKVNKDGEINPQDIVDKIRENHTAFVAITQCSNVTGSITDLTQIVEEAHKYGVKVLIDAAQSFAHIVISLRDLPVDYLVASAHKFYGPEGVGLLVLRKSDLARIEPLLVGGGMVVKAELNNYEWKDTEARLEAGTPNTACIVGTAEAIRFVQSVGIQHIQQEEAELRDYFADKICSIPNVQVIGHSKGSNTISLFSLSSSVHPHDLADYLDEQGIAVRAGHHCAQPLHTALGLQASVRASLSFLNTQAEIDYFAEQLQAALQKYTR